MKNRTLMCVFVLALCFMFLQFATLAYASDGEEILTVTAAWLDGEMLRINVTDANGESSALALRLTDYVSETENNEYISIQAVDLEGNKSGVIQIKNPYYDPTKEADIEPDTTTDKEVSPSPSELPQESQSAIPDESNAFTPSGTGTVMDNATDGDGKEFFTIDTEDGSVFYLIVDRQRNADNVYLLNTVTEDDLMALAQKSGKTINNGNGGSTSAIPSTEQPGTTDGENPPTTTATPEPESEIPATSGFNSNTLIFVAIAVLAVGGAGYYFKIVKGKKNDSDSDDYDDEDYDFEDEPKEPEESGIEEDYDVYEPDSKEDGV